MDVAVKCCRSQRTSLPNIFFEPTPPFIVVGGKRAIILSPNRFSGFSGEETVETVRRRGHDVIVTLINQGVDSTFLKKCQVVRSENNSSS